VCAVRVVVVDAESRAARRWRPRRQDAWQGPCRGGEGLVASTRSGNRCSNGGCRTRSRPIPRFDRRCRSTSDAISKRYGAVRPRPPPRSGSDPPAGQQPSTSGHPRRRSPPRRTGRSSRGYPTAVAAPAVRPLPQLPSSSRCRDHRVCCRGGASRCPVKRQQEPVVRAGRGDRARPGHDTGLGGGGRQLQRQRIPFEPPAPAQRRRGRDPIKAENRRGSTARMTKVVRAGRVAEVNADGLAGQHRGLPGCHQDAQPGAA